MYNGEKVVLSEQEFRTRFVYDQSDLLGEGGFAKVYKAYDRQFEETVALKFYTNSDADKYDIISEMKHSRKFTHKNVIRVHDACIVRFTNSFGITEDVQVGILEFANGGCLTNFLKLTPSEEEFKNVITGVLQGLYYLHMEKGVIHRDLSPDNILMFKDHNRWTPKIADFGISKQIDVKTINMGNQKVSSELVGKMEYMAPEQFDPKKYGINNRISTNVDLWSFGIVLTEVFTQATPFGDRNKSQNPMEIMHNVLHAPLPAYVNNIPEPYRTIIRKCLIKEAGKRVQSAKELLDILSDTDQPKKKISRRFAFTIILVLFMVCGAFVFWYTYPLKTPTQISNLPSGENKPTVEQVVLASEESDIGEKEEGEKATTGEAEELAIDVEDYGESGEQVQEMGGTKKTVPNSSPLLETNELHRKEELVHKVANALKLLDNDIMKPQIRTNQISYYINEMFIHGQAPVILTENGTIRQQEIQDFLEYVVKTSGVERRTWKIDPTLTKLEGDKISELNLSKN